MRKLMMGAALLVLLAGHLPAQQTSEPTGSASDTAALQQKIQDLEDRLIALEGEVRMLKSAQAGTAASTPQAGAPTTGNAAPTQPPAAPPVTSVTSAGGQVPVYGGATSAAKLLNPDISVIGDFIGAAGGSPALPFATQQPFPSLQMHESELGLQAIIDPYARGDFFLSFGEEGVDLEEGYITFTALPGSFVAKVGKMRSAFGKVNTLHNHVLPWIDRPLVSTNLVAGEDGIDDAGVSVERILPAPKGLFLDLTGQVFRGDAGDVFHAVNRSDVSTVDHLRAYKDITESTNLDIGFSYARGHSADRAGSIIPQTGDFITNLYGVDATVRWKPLRRSIYHSFVGRSEFIWSQRQQLGGEQRAFGFYTSAEYQLGRRWFLGGRYDLSDRAQFANLTDKGGSVLLTYWPSEFSQIRGQYRFTRYAENIDAHELLMQVIFSLGAHGAHPF
ncbi:MAG TPA: hypothetical protein VMT28_09830 [Terriglobales bacterium]|jgi:hypothetical protein|nr:hypothetical protein [Terriglobales bacterium]